MSSSGIDSINSGPLLIRTYNDSSANNTILLGTYDIPVASNYVLITSSNGTLAPSNNIYVSSISASSILSKTINVSTVNVSTLFFSTMIGSTIFTDILTYSTLIGSTIITSTLFSDSITTSTLLSSSIYTNFESVSSLRVSSINGQPYGYYWSNTGPTGLSINTISNASNTGPTGAVQAGTGAVYSIYGNQDTTFLNGDVGVTNNLLLAGATTYPDGSVAISNTPSLLYPNGANYPLVFKASTQANLSGFNWLSVAMSASGQYQTASNNNVWRSTDYGVSWTISLGTGSYNTLISASGQYQLVRTDVGTFYSSDYAVTWIQQPNSPQVNLSGIAMSSSGQYQTIVQYGGYIYYSSDYGINWAPSSSINDRATAVAMSSSGQYQTVCLDSTTFGNVIYYSNDYGVNWIQSTSFGATLNGISMSSSGQYQTIIINSSAIHYSTDYGVNWTASNAPGLYWRSVAMSSSGQYQTAAGDSSGIYYSTDYGKTWIQITTLPSDNWSSIAMSSSGQYITACASGDTIYTCTVPYQNINTITEDVQVLNVSSLVINNYPYGFKGAGSNDVTTTTFTNSTIYTVPANTTRLSFTLIGAGGNSVSGTLGGGGGAVVFDIISSSVTPIHTDDKYALYPGITKPNNTYSITVASGGGMSMVFSTNNSETEYNCCAIAAGGGGGGNSLYGAANGGGGGQVGYTSYSQYNLGGNPGSIGFGGTSGFVGVGFGAYNGNNFTMQNVGEFLTIPSLVGGIGGGGGGANQSDPYYLGGSGGDGYGGGGGGPSFTGGGGGGNYLNPLYSGTLYNGNGVTPGVSYLNYGIGAATGNPGIIMVTSYSLNSAGYTTVSLYDLIPDITANPIPSLGTSDYNWSSVHSQSFVKSGGTNTQYLMADGSVSALSSPYFTQTGPTGFSTNAISNAATTGPTGTVQAGTGAVFSIYNGSSNGDIGITNNLLVAGATTYPDGSVAISNTPSLLYSNNIIFTASSQSELNGQSWYSIAMSASGQYQTAIVNGGYIWCSTDYGVTWIKSISGGWKYNAMSSSGQYQSVCVQGGYIFYSMDYGVSWIQSNSNSDNWYSIAVSSSGQYQSACVANLSNGYIWISKNYGITWTQSTSFDSAWYSIAVSSSGQYQTACIQYNYIWYSTDYGVSWVQSNLVVPMWSYMAISSSGQYQSSCLFDNYIWYSTDYGKTWIQSNSIRSFWNSIAMSSSGQYQIASLYDGSIYYSIDYGKTWTTLISISASGTSLAMSSTGQYIAAVATNGTIYRANIPLSPTSYLTNTNLVIGNVRQNTGATGSIVLSASTTTMTGFSGSACYIKPIRSQAPPYTGGPTGIMVYNVSTSEITFNPSKTFIIDHPLDSSKYLVHACIEGPEAGVYYRGTSEIEKGKREQIVVLPEYVKSLATSFTVTITPIYNGRIRYLNCSDVTNNCFTVYGKPGRFNWIIFGKRLDIQVEPYKNEVCIKGDGPYKYI